MKGEKRKIKGEAAEHWARERERVAGVQGMWRKEGKEEDDVRGNRE